MKKDKILLTSSDNISDSKIEYQYGVVDSQIVIGANIFRDVFSSFRDIFGGETKGYKKDINKMKKAAFKAIRSQAKNYGANAIIALRLDLDEVSGGGKSMFMLNAYGSAVKLKESAFRQNKKDQFLSEFTVDDINYFKKRNQIKKIRDKTDNIVRSENLAIKISKYNLWNSRASENALLDAIDSYYEMNRVKETITYIPVKYIESFLENNISEIGSEYWELILDTLEEKTGLIIN